MRKKFEKERANKMAGRNNHQREGEDKFNRQREDELRRKGEDEINRQREEELFSKSSLSNLVASKPKRGTQKLQRKLFRRSK